MTAPINEGSTLGTEAPKDAKAATLKTDKIGGYRDPAHALERITDRYKTWTGQLTQRSYELSIAVIAANWAVFGGLTGLLRYEWAKWSMAIVLLGLLATVIGTWRMAELLRGRMNYAEADLERWDREYHETKNHTNTWPFGDDVDKLGTLLRGIKTWAPVIAGILFIVGLLVTQPAPSSENNGQAKTVKQSGG